MAEVILLVSFVGLGVFCLWASRSYRRVNDTEPRCDRCGYIVRGLPSPTCPECGSDLSPPGAIRFPGEQFPSGRAARLAGWSAFCLLAFLPLATVLWEPVRRRLPHHESGSGNTDVGRPASQAYAAVSLRWSFDRYVYAYSDRPDHLVIQLTCNDGRQRTLDVKGPSLAYRYHDALGAQQSEGPLTREVLLEWASQAGIATDDTYVRLELKVVASMAQYILGGGPGGGSAKGLFGSWRGGSSSSRRDPRWYGYVPLGFTGVVWLSIVIGARRSRSRSRAEREA